MSQRCAVAVAAAATAVETRASVAAARELRRSNPTQKRVFYYRGVKF